MVRTWFPDAGAGGSADGLALVAKQFTNQGGAGFGGAEIAFLSDNTSYTNADAQTIGFGSHNWRTIVKQILRTANGIPGGSHPRPDLSRWYWRYRGNRSRARRSPGRQPVTRPG